MLEPPLRHDGADGIRQGRQRGGTAAVGRNRTLSPIGANLNALLEAEREARIALAGLAGVVAAPESHACLDQLHYAMTWFCSGLEKHVRRRAKRDPAGVRAPEFTSDRLFAAPTGVDRIRLLTRMQRSMLARVEGVLAGSLPPDLRAFLEQARAVFAQSVRCCEEAIAALDCHREVRPDPPP